MTLHRRAVSAAFLAALLAACGGGGGTSDTTPPPAPVLTGTTPASPSTDPAPHVAGTAEAGAAVRLYGQAACAGAPLATALVGAAGTFDLAVAVAADAVTVFTANAMDAAGNVSPCSAGVTYRHDWTAPAAPSALQTSPASPSNAAAPLLRGAAEPLSTVQAFAGPGCAGAAVAQVTATAAGTFEVAAGATPNATTTWSFRATDAVGLTSPCSAALTYLHDGVAPAAPVIAGLSPASPSPDPSPVLRVTAAEAGLTLRLYGEAGCLGAATVLGASALGEATFTVTALPNALATFAVDAVDAAGNASACSAAATYLHDDVAPQAPALSATRPASPAGDLAPVVLGAAEALSAVSLYADALCALDPVATGQAAGDGSFEVAAAVAADQVTELRARARDAAGNLSACSAPLAYRHDGTPPAAPVLAGTSPASPSQVQQPRLTGTAEPGARLQVYGQPGCAGAPIVFPVVPADGAFDVVVPVPPDATTTLTATATDAAGNVSACSSALTYVHDATPPAAPTLLATTPASPAQALEPRLSGTAEPGSQVLVFLDAPCTGPSAASTFAPAGGAFDLPVLVAANATSALRAQAVDAAGNASTCSAPLDYRHDDVAPAAPVLAGSLPPSGSNANAPSITGTGEPGARVALYATADCSGGEAGSGAAAGGGAFTIAVAVADNSTTTFHASQVDQAGNASACSATSVTYVEESRTLLVTPANPLLDTAPSALSQQQFGYTLAGGPDEGVTWSVLEAGGGSITPGGLYTAPATPGTYHVVATTQGALPAFSGMTSVVVRHPVVAGTVTWGGDAGLIFVTVGNPYGGTPAGGTTLFVSGPGTWPFEVRGVASTGLHRVAAWYDAAQVERWVPAADPYGQVDVDLPGQSVAGVAVTLAAPAALPPPTAGVGGVLPGDGQAVVFFATPRDAQGRELAAAYHVECTTGAPPSTPGPGATHVPSGHDTVAFVYGLTNGVSTTCSVWTERGGALSAPAVSAPFTPGPGSGGFSVSGTLDWSGAAPQGPLFVVLYQPSTGQAFFQRHDAPAFPLAWTVAHVPAGSYALGYIVDTGADGRLGPADLNTLSGGVTPQGVTVAADVSGLSDAVTWPDASLHAVVGRTRPWDGPDRFDLVLMARSGARLPVQAVATLGPDLRLPADLGVSNDGGGSSVAFTALRGLGGTPPALGAYQAFVDYGDGNGALLDDAVTGDSFLEVPFTWGPSGGAAAPSRPVFQWADLMNPPPGGFSWRLELRTRSGDWIWDTDAFSSAEACGAGFCSRDFNFDGRASVADLVSGEYVWTLHAQSAHLDVVRVESLFQVPIGVTIAPDRVNVVALSTQRFTATLTGQGTLSWASTCGPVTPLADPAQADVMMPADLGCDVTVTATAAGGLTASDTAFVNVLPIHVAAAPASATVGRGQTQYFTAAVDGPGSVQWGSTCMGFSTTADPLVAAVTPPAFAGAVPCDVWAWSTVQPIQEAHVQVTITADPWPVLEPPLAVLNPGQRQPYLFTLGGAPQPATFAVLEAGGGTIDADGLYTAPGAPGRYHVVASDPADASRTRTALVQVVDAAASPQPAVAITPAAPVAVAGGQVSLSATLDGCASGVTWTLLDADAALAANGPWDATFGAPAAPGRFRVLATSTCDPARRALAVVAVEWPSVSGTVTAPAGSTGPVYLALLTSWGEVVGGTSLLAPGPFTLRGVRQTGNLTLWAWRDVLGTGKPAPRFDPLSTRPVTVAMGGKVTGADLALAAPAPAPAPPAVPFALAFPGEGTMVFMWNRAVDGNGDDLADRYHVQCDTWPTPTSPRTFETRLSDAQVAVLDAAPGSQWTCTLAGSAGGLRGPAIATGVLTLSAAPGGHAVSGTVDLGGPSPGGHLFVALYADGAGLVPAFIGAPAFPQPFAIAGAPDGAWRLGAILDVNGDGVISRTEPNLFNGGAVPVTVSGADLSGLSLSLPMDDATFTVTTRRSDGFLGVTSYGLRFLVRSGLRVPVSAVLQGGPGVGGPVDLGMRFNEGGDQLEFGTSAELGSTPPVVGTRYTATVTWDDGTSSDLTGEVTAILQPPQPISPVGPLPTPMYAPAVPTFTWSDPAALPAGPYTWSVWMTQGASWWASDLPPAQHGVTYGTGQQAGSPPQLPAGSYGWVVSIRDAAGNEASREAAFVVSAP